MRIDMVMMRIITKLSFVVRTDWWQGAFRQGAHYKHNQFINSGMWCTNYGNIVTLTQFLAQLKTTRKVIEVYFPLDGADFA